MSEISKRLSNQELFNTNITQVQANSEDKLTEINSYKDKGLRNSVKLINKYEEDNKYLALFTELDSHIEENDIVFITKISGNSNLDNFNDYKYDDDFPFTNYSMGYRVLKVNKNKNKIVINKLFKDTIDNLDIKEHYISLIRKQNSTIENSKLNSVVTVNSKLKNNEITQGTFLNMNASGCTFKSKYDNNYKSLERKSIEGNGIVNFNNYTYGYNFISYINSNNVNNLFNCEIENGNFINTNIINKENEKKTIPNGKFENCYISNYIIKGGYYLNCIIESDCKWENGTFENNNGEDFKPEIWYDGKWLYGNFSGKTWKNGIFNGRKDTLFIDSIWEDGLFNTGTIKNTDWLNGFFDSGNIKESNWTGGTFNNGLMINCNWQNGILNNGVLDNILWENGTMYNGQIKNSIWEYGEFYYGLIKDSEWYHGKLYNGHIKNSIWKDGHFGHYYYGYFYNNNIMENCIWSGGTFFNGTLINTTWQDGKFYNGLFTKGDWYNGTWFDGTMRESYVLNITWYFGYMYNCKLDEDGEIIWYGGTMENTDFVSRTDSKNITEL